MYFSRFIAPLLFGSALAAPVLVERQSNATSASATALLDQISVIQKAATELNTTVSGLTAAPKIVEALTIELDSTALDKDIIEATSIVNGSAPFSESDSAAIATKVLALGPQIESLLKNLAAHKASFQKVAGFLDLTKVVLNSLTKEKEDTNIFGTALGGKLAGVYATQAPAINSQIQGYFTTAIAAFSADSTTSKTSII